MGKLSDLASPLTRVSQPFPARASIEQGRLIRARRAHPPRQFWVSAVLYVGVERSVGYGGLVSALFCVRGLIARGGVGGWGDGVDRFWAGERWSW